MKYIWYSPKKKVNILYIFFRPNEKITVLTLTRPYRNLLVNLDFFQAFQNAYNYIFSRMKKTYLKCSVPLPETHLCFYLALLMEYWVQHRIKQNDSKCNKECDDHPRPLGGGGGTLIFSHIRRLGPLFWVKNSEFQYFWGFSENEYFLGVLRFCWYFLGVITKLG